MESFECTKCRYPFQHFNGACFYGCPLCKSSYVKWVSYNETKDGGQDKRKYLTTEQAVRKFGP